MSKAPDALGDRLKGYESAGEGPRLDVTLPIYARIDGRGFSKFTRGMNRPFDVLMSGAMALTMRDLVDQTHARLGYTQSDEISLVFMADKPESDTIFNGRTQKLVSILASLTTAIFTRHIPEGWAAKRPHFDCRVCQLPSKAEAANMFLWRWKDATKNAISMVAQDNFSHKQLHGKHGGEMMEMLRAKGIEFDNLPAFFRRGTFGRRVAEFRKLTTAELERIPEKHRPIGPVQRHRIDTFEVEDFFGVENRETFVFGETL